MADASRTTLLTGGFPAALGDQFVGKTNAFGDVFANEFLRTLDTLCGSRYTDLTFLRPEDDFLASFESDGLSNRGGDYNSAIFVEAEADGLWL
jgi:hypothetical protein